MKPIMRPMSSWGRLSSDPHEVVELVDRRSVARQLAGQSGGIAYGMGRSYGDACLNANGKLWSTARLDRFIAFDEATGRLCCEAGIVLRDIQRLVLPHGWGLPVVPGTQIATVGGAIANDVHGKNHHLMGTFGDHVRSLRLVRTDGEVVECGPELRRDWLAATVGGLGLTGLITEAELQLRRVPGPWLEGETIAFAGLGEFFQLSDDAETAWEHTVSWIDCTAAEVRGLFMRARPGRHEQGRSRRERRLRVPFTPPVSLVNRLTLRPFNDLYFRLNRRRTGPQIVDCEPFLHPLDAVGDWNRLYGPKGFYQYQCVVPREAGPAAVQELLGAIARTGLGSVLAVLKTFGARWPLGLISFVRPGVTLALDFPNAGPVEKLFERLDAVVRAAGGRIYPAKDARMPRELFEATYPKLGEFAHYRDRGMSSGLSRRLMGS